MLQQIAFNLEEWTTKVRGTSSPAASGLVVSVLHTQLFVLGQAGSRVVGSGGAAVHWALCASADAAHAQQSRFVIMPA